MLTKKFLASAVATIAIAGSIGVAIAQTATPAYQQPDAAKSETTGSPATGASGSAASTDTPSAPASGAGSTMSNEASPRGTLN